MLKAKHTKALSILAATLLGTSAYAAEEVGTIIADWQIYGDGILFFDLTGTHNGTCSFPERWALDTQSPVGKAQYAAFLTALTTGKTVHVVGSGVCAAHGNTEWVFTFRVIG